MAVPKLRKANPPKMARGRQAVVIPSEVLEAWADALADGDFIEETGATFESRSKAGTAAQKIRNGLVAAELAEDGVVGSRVYSTNDEDDGVATEEQKGPFTFCLYLRESKAEEGSE